MNAKAMNAAGVRAELVHRLRRNLVGPCEPEDADLATERLPPGESPSRWYLSGFIAPTGDLPPDSLDAEFDEGDGFFPEPGPSGTGGAEGDDDEPDQAPARRRFLPGSIGMSTSVDADVEAIDAVLSWGDYVPEPALPAAVLDGGIEPREPITWRRVPQERALRLHLPREDEGMATQLVPGSGSTARPGGALEIAVRARPFSFRLPSGRTRAVRVVTVFLVNKRVEPAQRFRDLAYAYQVRIALACPSGFVPQHDLSRVARDDWDDQLADLHYRDSAAYAAGLGCAVAHAADADGCVRRVWTTHLPRAAVERTVAAQVEGVTFGMDRLAALAADGGLALAAALRPLASDYADWIGRQAEAAGTDGSIASAPQRAATAAALVGAQRDAGARIAAGIALIETDERARTAFRIANRAVADALRARGGQALAPAWRPFQLAFLLLNLPGMADKTHPDRELADLLFFPTGGGKTEAYLGLAAFTIAHRRLGAAGLLGAGVSVVMRYTLRLLTLDQLGRAAGLVCALELLRTGPDYRGADGRALLGDWPIEIGLWVGSDASPNRLGGKGDRNADSAVARVRAYQSGRDARAPAPIKACPWCGTAFTPQSFRCVPDAVRPINLELRCASPDCAFTGDRPLPVVTVDDAIYRRLPAFLVATVDKFASLPWKGQAGAFFGHVDRADEAGFYGAAEAGGRKLDGGSGESWRLDPPDLIVQDELHLISGPLGTIAGLYEAAIDRLATRGIAGVRVRPKIVASTATVRRAKDQIKALFDRPDTRIFPPPGIDRRDSFFALTRPESAGDPARWYVGLAAAGRGPKLVFLQALVSLLSGAERLREEGGQADAYLTALCYFNALRELGGARRIVEDEVAARAARYGSERRRLEPADRPFADRQLGEPIELTSRVSTDQVAAAKRRLEALIDTADASPPDGFAAGPAEPVDVALTTNMISVGLDIDRLGLMLVQGQPKTAAEYIQATSRVGRNPARPGLVLVVLNVHKPRDRMHFEQFGHFHDTFYRAVEATSVTPWSARALDRALAAVVVAIARHLRPELTPSAAVRALEGSPETRAEVVRHLVGRAPEDLVGGKAALAAQVEALLDGWVATAAQQTAAGVAFTYGDRPHRLLHPPLDPALPNLDPAHRAFQAGWSMRDIEPGVLVKPRDPFGEAVAGAGDLS